MSATRPILESILAHLQAALPNYAVEMFPEQPDAYQFLHPSGAVLIGYQGSKFKELDDLDLITQQRNVIVHFTVFGRGVHSDGGALDLLDGLRLAIVGFQPINCQRCHLIEEAFLTEDAGAWQYQLRVQTETLQVEKRAESNLPKFVEAIYRQRDQPLDPNLKPKP